MYEETFLRDRRLSRLVFLRRGWGVLLDRVARYFESRGGVVRRGTRVESLVVGEDGRACGVRLAERPREREAIASGAAPRLAVEGADAVVSAVPPDALAAMLPAPAVDRHRARAGRLFALL